MDKVQKLFNYYLAHQDELVVDYNGKNIVIHDNKVEGAFDSAHDAYQFGVNNFGLGNFIFQLCTPGEEAYTRKFYTQRVSF